jgi:hypothetical protein
MAKQSLFQVAYGMERLQCIDLVFEELQWTLEFSQDGKDLVEMREQMVEKTKLLLERTQHCYIKQVNAGIWNVEYQVDYKVLLNVKNFAMHKRVQIYK